MSIGPITPRDDVRNVLSESTVPLSTREILARCALVHNMSECASICTGMVRDGEAKRTGNNRGAKYELSTEPSKRQVPWYPRERVQQQKPTAQQQEAPATQQPGPEPPKPTAEARVLERDKHPVNVAREFALKLHIIQIERFAVSSDGTLMLWTPGNGVLEVPQELTKRLMSFCRAKLMEGGV